MIPQGPEWHLNGWSKESKSHFKTAEFVSWLQQELRRCGPALVRNGITIMNGCFACDICNCVKPWENVLDHVQSKNHCKLLDNMDPKFQASFGEPNEMEIQAWLDLFPEVDQTQKVITQLASSRLASRAISTFGQPDCAAGPM